MEPAVLGDVTMPGLKILDKNGREKSLLRQVVENRFRTLYCLIEEGAKLCRLF